MITLPDCMTTFVRTNKLVTGVLLCIILLSLLFNNNVSRNVSFSFLFSGNLTETKSAQPDLDRTGDGFANLLEGEFKSCPNVISRMVIGHWVRHKDYSKEDIALVDDALRKTLMHNNMPPSLQNKDKRCGNTILGGNPYFRALCEPEGETPCCLNYMCVNKTIDQCQGPWALDIRQLIQAEFATWIPDDPNCKVVDLTSEETACQVLKNVTIYFVGESLTRQMYISVLGFLRDEKYETHVLVDNSTAARNCHTYYRYSPPCRPYFLQDSIECSGTTRIRFRQLLSSNEASEMLSQFRELLNVPNSFYVLGFGFHNRFQAEPVVTKVFNPIFKELANATWPKFIWLATHMPTMLQTTTSYMQQPTEILAYNEAIKVVLAKHKVPVMDWTQLTANAMGIDNIHYGKGVNDVKAVILLNLLLELRHNSTWMLEKQIPGDVTTTHKTTATTTRQTAAETTLRG
ncbi:uncharacterized protein LOC106072744 [Biomphalaria glabrata]|uniref:Uncharacterized protein LOC106072744 n=1 Tax=Biomphalaria glabrata TaxID=6526 RepID=A0A9W2ZIF8_BIOGL|nr:uncharacterized protein LOC106072744 [Biomphalaria glabrata]